MASVKDSITSGLPSQEQNVGGGTSGSNEMPTRSRIGNFEIHVQESGEDIDEGRMAPAANYTEEKGS